MSAKIRLKKEKRSKTDYNLLLWVSLPKQTMSIRSAFSLETFKTGFMVLRSLILRNEIHAKPGLRLGA